MLLGVEEKKITDEIMEYKELDG